MRIAQAFPGSVLSCLIILTLAGPMVGQTSDPPTGPDKDAPNQPLEFKGEAKVSVHPYKMDKGSMYRITVKGDGFQPQVWVWTQDQNKGTIGNAPSISTGNAGQPPIRSNVAQIIFTPLETKVHQIKVDYNLGSDINKGSNAYTLTIEKAGFKSLVLVNEPRLEIGEHTKKMEQGKVYGITVTGKGFGPEVQIMEGKRSVATAYNGRWFGFGPDAEFVTNMIFTPTRTMDYRILVGVGPIAEKRQAPLAHTTEIVELKLALSAQGQIASNDPVDARVGSPCKLHTVKLEADKNYQIDMVSPLIDPYLILEDSAGKVLRQDDDSGGNLNARIIFRPTKTDTYRIVATVFKHVGAANKVSPTGPYTLTVVENPHAQPRFGLPSTFGTSFPDSQK